jgi:hypothetical protein
VAAVEAALHRRGGRLGDGAYKRPVKTDARTFVEKWLVRPPTELWPQWSPNTRGGDDRQLEKLLENLPGMENTRAVPLLGVRPLERTEALAKVIRCECTPWEAYSAYYDSHMLYIRQWLALQLQALWRARQAGRYVRWRWRQRDEDREDERLWRVQQRAVGFWSHNLALLTFNRWVQLVRDSRAAMALAENFLWKSADPRLRKMSRAWNAWVGRTGERERAWNAINNTALKWLRIGVYRALRTWKARTEQYRRAVHLLHKSGAGFLAGPLKRGFNTWADETRRRRDAVDTGGRVVRNWRNRSLSEGFHKWVDVTEAAQRRRGRGGRHGYFQPETRMDKFLHRQAEHLLELRCWKKGRRSGRWRDVRIHTRHEDNGDGGYITYSRGLSPTAKAKLVYFADIDEVRRRRLLRLLRGGARPAVGVGGDDRARRLRRLQVPSPRLRLRHAAGDARLGRRDAPTPQRRAARRAAAHRPQGRRL